MRRTKQKKSGKVWLILIAVVFILGIIGSIGDKGDEISKIADTSPLVSEKVEINAKEEVSEEPQDKANEPSPSTEVSPYLNEERAETASDEVDGSGIVLTAPPSFDVLSVPAYSGAAYCAVNGNEPFFDESEITNTSYEYYSEQDSLGRCGTAVACIGKDIMPTEERGEIGQVKPTGWHTVRYDNVDGGYLYNRCHLIGYQLSGENANVKNLITGTRYLNMSGMLPFENMVADYIKETDNHVMYRVTPIFDGDDLLASGVLIEAESVEDSGDGIRFCVYCYNVQPGISIDYSDGESFISEPIEEEPSESPEQDTKPAVSSYILNLNTKKFHRPTCSSVNQMKESNKYYFEGTRDEVIAQGYEPCKKCNP